MVYSIMVLWFSGFRVLWFYGIMVLWFLGFQKLPIFYFMFSGRHWSCSHELQDSIVQKLKDTGYQLGDFWDVIKSVEFHSPLEHDKRVVASNRGFSVDQISDQFFPNLDLLGSTTYSTIFSRPTVSPFFRRIIEKLFPVVFGHDGNHIAYIFIKR